MGLLLITQFVHVPYVRDIARTPPEHECQSFALNSSACNEVKEGWGCVLSKFGNLLLVCAENHEATILSPGRMVALVPLVSNEDNTVYCVIRIRLPPLSIKYKNLPGGCWMHASFHLRLGHVVQAYDQRLTDAIYPTKAAPIKVSKICNNINLN